MMFHPVFVSLCFSIIYFMFHSIPSSYSLSVQHCHNEASCYDLHRTVSSEFSSFNTIPLSFFLTSQRTRKSHTCQTFSSLFLFYSLEIFSLILDLCLVSLLSICALLTSGLSLILFTILLLLTQLILITLMFLLLLEIWISPNTTSAQLFDAIPRGCTIISTPRPVPDSFTSSIVVKLS